MKKFTAQLSKILGREPDSGEMQFFNCFNPETFNKQKRFDRYSSTRALFLNVDDEHYMYVSNHTSKLRCCLDMATRRLNGSEYYQHDQGTIMLGITEPENEKHLNSRISNYHIYLQSTGEHGTEQSLKMVSSFADHISLIRDETPWERICAMCVETKTGIHLTCSSNRLLKHYTNGLIYVVEELQDRNFKNAIKDLDTLPAFIGKTMSYPIISLDNELAIFELPITGLKQLFLLQNANLSVTSAFNDMEDESELVDLKKEPDSIIEKLEEYIECEKNDNPPKTLHFDNIQDLYIENFPLKSLSFSANGLSMHTLSSIVSLYYRGLKPIALSYFAQTKAEYPQEIDAILNAISKAAKLFSIPTTNNCVIHGKSDKLKLFFICKKMDNPFSNTFENEGDFICLLGDPNGELRGSAYAQVLGFQQAYTPPGVMAGTLAALVDVLDECSNSGIISSASFIGRGGLFFALKTSCGNSKGAKIYSERKRSEQAFIFGEHQAAALISIKEKHLIDLARITSNLNLTSITIGRVSDIKEISINNKSMNS